MSADWLVAVEALVSAPTSSDLARRAVEIARLDLGLERVSLWLREGDRLRGTWGTDLAGETTDERSSVFHYGVETAETMASGDRWRVTMGPDPVREGDLEVPRDWVVVTPLRADGRAVGIIYNDRPGSTDLPDPERQDELAAYAEVVARLLQSLWRIEEAEMLGTLASTLSALTEPTQMARAVAQSTQPLLGWDRFCLACLTDDGSWFEQVGVAMSADQAAICSPGRLLAVADFGQTMAPLVHHEPISLSWPTADQVHPGCPGVGLGSAYYQPIVSRGELVGVLMVAAEEPDRYAAREGALIAAVAAVVAPTLDRMNLMRRATQAADEYRTLVEAIPDVVLVFDRDGVCRSVPSPGRLLVIDNADEVVGHRMTELFGPDLAPVERAQRVALDEGSSPPIRYRLARGDRSVWFEGRGVSMGDRVLWMARDITEALRAEEQLREVRIALDHAAELSRIGAWMHDLATDRNIWSPSMCALHGLPAREQVFTLSEILDRFGQHPDAEATDRAMRAMMVGGGRLDRVMRFYRADGQQRLARMVADVERDADGRPQRIYGMMQDITEQAAQDAERLQLQERLAQSSKMEAIGVLAGGVAHDFNNLLTTINGYAEFLLAEAPEGRLRDDLGEIRLAAQRAASLTRQLLAFSRRSVIQPVDLDLNQVVAELERMLVRLVGEDVEFRVALCGGALPMHADRGQVEQMVVNLVANARDALHSGGRLTVTTGSADLTVADLDPLTEAEPGHYVCLTVDDTGCGMSPEVLARAFEPFYTTKPVGEGTGLGLASVYGAVRQNRGHITCRSAVDQGTTFTIYLPASAAAPRPSPARERAAEGGGECVLLVEDDSSVRGYLERALRGAGYSVLVAADGEQATRVLAQRRADLLLSDVIMPGVNGRVLADRLRAAQPDLRVLLMSGYTAAVIAQKGLGVVDLPLLYKPFGARELLTKVREVLSG